MPSCYFFRAWAGHCGAEVPFAERFCEQHRGVKCVVCGRQAERECGVSSSLVCGAPLCDSSECYSWHQKKHFPKTAPACRAGDLEPS